jgi:SAM-dependent methyltransferase
MAAGETADHVLRNRAAWERYAPEYVQPARLDWAASEPRWGIWGIAESELGVLPDVGGRDVIELGCGTAYVSSWVARRGGRPLGIDNAAAQLRTARAFQREFACTFPLLQADAEAVPLAASSFDVAISEYGACLWCDPDRWIPEAARLLRPGGTLVFLTNAALLMLCAAEAEGEAAGTELRRDHFGMHHVTWPNDPSVEFHLGHGDWVRVLRANGLVVEDLLEVRPGPDAVKRYDFVTREWARRWPSEEVWKARKVASPEALW